MGFFDKIFGGKAKDVVDSVGVVLDDLFTSKEERAKVMLEIDKEVNRHLEVIEAEASKLLEIELKDRERASAMQIAALNQDDRFSKRFLYYLAAFMMIAATSFGLMLCFVTIPEKNQRLVEMFADFFFISGVGSVIGFFFGSSKSSQDKSTIIHQLSK
jgi:nitroreductase